MSIEQLILDGKKKDRAKAAKKRKHYHGIAAHDDKYTGTEPVWDAWKTWTVAKFMDERHRALNFYNYYQTAKEMKPAVLDWMTAHSYSKDDIKMVKRAPDWSPGITTASLCTCMNRGMPAFHPEAQKHHDSMPGIGGTARSDEDFIRENIVKAIAEGKRTEDPEEKAAAATVAGTVSEVISPMVRLQRKVKSTIILELDLMLDSWMKNPEDIKPIPVYTSMQNHGLPAQACADVDRFLTRYIDEIMAAREKTDEFMIEAYKILSTKQKDSWIDALTTMRNDLKQFKHTAKAKREPREKKLPSAMKQIEKLKYLKESVEFKIASVNPIRVAGAYRLLVFNTKYRCIYDFVASGPTGMLIKGTSLKNLDESLCRMRRLRKPEEFLPIALSGSPSQIDKAWEKLTTKEAKPKNRINEEMVLLRVFEKPTDS